MPDLEFNFKPSRQYLAFITIFVLTSAGMTLLLPLGIWLKTMIFALTLGYGMHVIWKYGLLLSSHSIKSIRRHSDGSWHLTTQTRVYPAQINGDSTVTSIVSVLRFQLQGHKLPVSCIIFRDSLGTEVYRRLLVVLKMC